MKKISSLIAVVLIFANTTTYAFAAGGDNYKNNANEKTQTEVVVPAPNPKTLVKPLYGESEVSTVLQSQYYTITTTPDGQLPGGTQFPTGGGFYINTSGGASATISFGLNWGIYNMSVSAGYASTGNIGGKFVLAPDTIHYFKAKIDKTYLFQYVKVDHYQYGVYQYTYYTTWSSLYRESAYAVAV